MAGGRALLAVVLLVVAACAPSDPTPTPPLTSPSVPGASPSPTSSTLSPAPSVAIDRALATAGRIAVVSADGSLSLVDTHGRATLLADSTDGTFGFPAWSPDASRIAAVRDTAGATEIDLLEVPSSADALPVTPRVIFRSATISPFYLSWSPDGTSIAFLANDGGGLKLRLVRTDGSAPLDGSGPGTIIRSGNPFYFDWIDPTHLLTHVGTGTDAFLGEIGTDGTSVGAVLSTSPGGFRSPDVSRDGRLVAYVRTGPAGVDSVVVATRDGATEESMPVIGPGAVSFSPTDDVVAAIGSVDASTALVTLPVGPLRLADARTGSVRTLFDGSVVSVAWSPDGTMIAAIHVVPASGGSTVSSMTPVASTTPSGGNVVHLAFIDVASGKVRSDPAFSPGQRFVDAVLPYFDQYALSHHLWAPDGSSILIPAVALDGTTHVDVFFPDGETPVALDGEVGFWSPSP